MCPRYHAVTAGGKIQGSDLKYFSIIETSHGVDQVPGQGFTNGVSAEHLDHTFKSSEVCCRSVIMKAFIVLF